MLTRPSRASVGRSVAFLNQRSTQPHRLHERVSRPAATAADSCSLRYALSQRATWDTVLAGTSRVAR